MENVAVPSKIPHIRILTGALEERGAWLCENGAREHDSSCLDGWAVSPPLGTQQCDLLAEASRNVVK